MNKFEARSKKSYNKKAESYDQTFDGKFTVKFKRIIVDSLRIQNGNSVCDIACGNGRLLKTLSERADFRGFGVDISDKMVAQAKKLNPTMQFCTAGCDNLPFEKQSMDIMTVCAAFHHFPDVEAFASEAARTLKPGGVLYIADVYLPNILRIICNPFVRFSKAGDVKFYSPKEITRLFEAKGFSAVSAAINGTAQLIVLRKN